MKRIYTDNPSSGKPIRIVEIDIPANEWVTLAEPPDFSVPEEDEGLPSDPADDNRSLLPGKLFIQAGIVVTNKTSNVQTFSMRLLLEGDESSENAVLLISDQFIPPNEPAIVALRGQELFKSSVDSEVGDRLQIRVNTANAFDVFGTVIESPLPEHAPDTESAL
jgi:hypothetical protein